MSERIRQHYVPQAYLKFFARQKGKIWETGVLDKKGNKLYCANIRDVAFEKNFYTVERLGKKKYAWEEYYAEQVEPLIGKTFKTLIQNCTNIFAKDRQVVISKEIRTALSVIIITQLLRTPKARFQQYEISSNVFPTVMENIRKSLEPYANSEQRNYLYNLEHDDVFKEIDMLILTDPARIKRFSQIIGDRCWIVYRNDDFKNNPYVTSDHPVIQYNLVTSSTLLSENGIGNPQTIIKYPINSQLLLAIYDKRNFLFQSLEDMDGKLVFLSEKDTDYIMKVNQMQYEQSIQHVYFMPYF